MRKQLVPIDTIIYQSKSGALELKTDKEHETIGLPKSKWLHYLTFKKQPFLST